MGMGLPCGQFLMISSCPMVAHGFKLSPVIGKILCELALDKSPSYDLSPFAVDRFSRRAKL